MEPQTIMSRLAVRQGGFPKEALQAAAERRAVLVPEMIEEIEALAVRPDLESEAAGRLFFSFHLLGEWRETAAYRPLLRLLQLDGETLEELLGDAISVTLRRVVASVYDGDPQPLFEAILNPQADEFVRASLCEALIILVAEGSLDRELAVRFLRDGFLHLEPQGSNHVWYGWQRAVSCLGLSELKPFVEKAFARNFIDPCLMTFEDFLRDLEAAEETPLGYALEHQGEPLTPFDDTIAALSGWAAFNPEPEETRRSHIENWLGSPPPPSVNPHRGVGRNDPCPCGSGKKFKKCCLQ